VTQWINEWSEIKLLPSVLPLSSYVLCLQHCILFILHSWLIITSTQFMAKNWIFTMSSLNNYFNNNFTILFLTGDIFNRFLTCFNHEQCDWSDCVYLIGCILIQYFKTYCVYKCPLYGSWVRHMVTLEAGLGGGPVMTCTPLLTWTQLISNARLTL